MIYQAKLLRLNNLIEEEVYLDINGIKLIGFATICPYKIFPNNFYPVELHLTFLDDEKFEELKEKKYGLEKLNKPYAYMLYGEVRNGYIDLGNEIKIQDDLFDEYSYLNGKFIELKVDRLTVEFK